MRFKIPVTLLCSSLLLISCTSASPADTESTAQSSSSVPAFETTNVRFRGTVTTSPTVPGLPVLQLADGTTIALATTDNQLDLRSYDRKVVEARGSAQPYGDNGTLLRVQEIVVLGSAVSSAASQSAPEMCGGIGGIACRDGFVCTDDLTDDCDPENGGRDCSGVCVPAIAASVSSSSSSIASSASSMSSVASVAKVASSAKPSPVLASSSSSIASSVAPVPSSSASAASSASVASNDASTKLMAKQDYQTSLWTQQYCTSHIDFCVPVHKNWYFVSYGLTTSNLWHVEFGMSELKNLGDGAIVLNLVSGSSASAGHASGQVVGVGSDVVGYLDWGNNHFEISGNASLRSAIEYMLSHIVQFSQS